MHALAAWSTSPRSWCKALVEGVLRPESLVCYTALHVFARGGLPSMKAAAGSTRYPTRGQGGV